ncbi:hypothetical protein [Microcella pacifica]|uniref:Uncharacterized protein n=1 Tax=Microcella pacifica TaxID=2591847 RepID=A0A9E5JTM1_9MICO|nr:hypothetical protein [Microcella pacifica]NHF62233.1 hypothetical protein [Microcella pacifica]
MPGGTVVADRQQLTRLLGQFRDLPPKVRTSTRRELRAVGDDVIGEQRAILSGPLPAGVEVAGQSRALAYNKKTGQFFTRKINLYADREVQRPGRSTGLRERIKAGLVTRVVTGKTRQGIDIRTQNRKAPMSTGWNAKRFRHPVFGNKERWVYQAGQPYFFKPVFKGRADMIRRAAAILNDAVEGR